MDKAAQRRSMLQELAAVDADLRAEAGLRIAQSVMALPEMEKVRKVMAFLCMADELDADPLLRLALDAGQEVYAPRTIMKSRQLVPVKLHDLECVECGAYGIREPATAETATPEELDAIIVPGVAFDRRCRRLGRGGGFYDRLLAALPEGGLLCGVAYSFQIVDEVVCEPHDLPVHLVVTDDEVIRP